ncbi:Sugar kinase of the NBD/HSP70 family, may contain an N-terminal HTH domain [Microbacterium enclense]|uniref:Sugar kinase of the NBD/HSP70 family, may contain an N-terminal HTH domain n=2 Tax=Microbacterium enclense TaxID=993073 RepID=A0A1G6QPN1_9MICO|nr:Sugar kinase of the NBD/HSP70 family, may contain an N-terminal HTH domain [Microbacterium enclense]
MTATPSLRRHNLDAVLAAAWDSEAFTASDVIAAVGLTRSTAIDVVDELTARGLLAEMPNARAVGEYSKGRPARRFAFRPDAGVVVGVDAGRGHLTATVADLRGRTIGASRLTVDPELDSPERRRRAAEATVGAALTRARRSRDEVVALCVGVPAPVNRQGRSPVHHDGFWARMNPDFIETFAAWAPLVRVENDATLAAVAERTHGAAAGCDDFVALLAGERFGAGISVDGRLLRGTHGGAGETVAFDRVEGVGSAWGLAPRCVEAARAALASGALPPDSALRAIDPDHLEAKTVLDLAAAGDAGALEVAREVGGALAGVAAIFGSLFDVELVVVSGAIAAGSGPIIEAAIDAIPDSLHLPAPRIVASTLGADIVSIGAVAAAVEAARAHALDLDAFALPEDDRARA